MFVIGFGFGSGFCNCWVKLFNSSAGLPDWWNLPKTIRPWFLLWRKDELNHILMTLSLNLPICSRYSWLHTHTIELRFVFFWRRAGSRMPEPLAQENSSSESWWWGCVVVVSNLNRPPSRFSLIPISLIHHHHHHPHPQLLRLPHRESYIPTFLWWKVISGSHFLQPV